MDTTRDILENSEPNIPIPKEAVSESETASF